MADIIDRLANPEKVYPEDGYDDMAIFKHARDEIIRLRKKCDKQSAILQHVFPDKSGRYFISGQGGEVDHNGLPDTVSICPAYGVGRGVKATSFFLLTLIS